MSPPLSRRRFLAGTAVAGTAATAGGIPATTRAMQDDGSELDEYDALEAFVDDAIESELADQDVSGAVVSVVHDGSVALASGYGETSFDGEAVTPAETPVHTGSISKVLTYTAAMGLVEEGEIDPDDDITDALESVSIPETHDEPITLAHLATHTAGFEMRSRNDTVDDVADRQPLEEAVGTFQPGRIQPPGELMGYTNYAAALTGQVVADVSGMTFQEYLETSVFEPLGMDSSTFDAVPEHLDDDTRDGIREDSLWHSNVPPASGLWSTGDDMARFMLAHLEGGATDDGRILSAEATDEMHQQWFTPHEELDRMAFGFFERTRDDVRLLYHSGEGPGYGSLLVLVPEHDLGLFVAFQGQVPGSAVASFEDAFLDRYVPTTDAELTPDGPPERADELEGTYRSLANVEQTTYEKPLFTALSTDVEVRIDDDGTLITDTGTTTRWVEVEPLVFRRADGQRALVFHEEDGNVTGFSSEERAWAVTSISWYDDLSVQAGLAVGSSLVVLSGVLGWPLAAAVRRYRGTSAADSSPQRRARWTAGAAGGLLIGFLLALVALEIALFTVSGGSILDRPPRGFVLLFGLPILAAVATLVAAGYAVRSWHEGFWSLPARLHYTAVVGALVVSCWVFRYWNLLGLRV